MARILDLKKVPTDQVNGSRPLDFGDLMLVVLRTAPPGRGVNLDEVLSALEVIDPIEEAIAAGAEQVTLSETQWQTLRAKLDGFAFATVDRAVAQFGLMVRNAPELGVEPPRRNGRTATVHGPAAA